MTPLADTKRQRSFRFTCRMSARTRRTKRLPLAICFLSICAFLSCARHDLQSFRTRVSEGIEAGTGHRLGPATRAGQPSIPESVSLEDGVTEDEAVALALWNNAAFQEILTELGLARADLIQAGLLSNPVFSVLFPVGPRQWESTLAIPVEALLLRPRRLTIAELQSRHVVQRLMQNGLDLVRDVRVAWADLAYARDRLRLGEERAQLLGRIAELSKKRRVVGDARIGGFHRRPVAISRRSSMAPAWWLDANNASPPMENAAASKSDFIRKGRT